MDEGDEVKDDVDDFDHVGAEAKLLIRTTSRFGWTIRYNNRFILYYKAGKTYSLSVIISFLSPMHGSSSNVNNLFIDLSIEL